MKERLKKTLSELDDFCSNAFSRVKVWNVGQGNTNSMEDDFNHTVIFDFGASIYMSNAEHKDVINKIMNDFINKK